MQGSRISRHHAEVVRDGPVALVRDLDSKNGTRVGGRRVHQAPLDLGAVVRVGDAVGIVVELPCGATKHAFGELAPGVFGGARLASVFAPLERAAPSKLPVVLLGETGSGKERVARAIHAWSGRRGRFVALNCAALPETLAEAELFGYRRGAFTGATESALGYFRAADGGTLLLDEVTELPLPLQAKLLRAIEESEVVPLGESSAQAIDVRVVAASQQPLVEAVAAGRFRADLFARLNGVVATLPPLRERYGDVPLLFERLLCQHAAGDPPRVDASLVEQLSVYHWPLNVRELDLQVQRLLTLHGDVEVLTREHLSEPILLGAGAEVVSDLERDLETELLDGLRAHRGNVSRAARALGISRQRAYRLLEGLGMDLSELRGERGET